MQIDEFKIEQLFARWEFSAPYILGGSDVEGIGKVELLDMADADGRARWENLQLGYTETLGHPELRREIAGLYRGVGAEQVIVFGGASEALFVLMNVLLAAGDHAVVVTPCYQSLYSLPRALGVEVTLVPLDPARGWALDVARVAQAVGPRTKLIVVNFPNSPTGALPDRRTFDELVGVAERAGAWLFSDEVYRLLEHDSADRLPAGVEAYERGFSVGVMSKVFGLAGLRIGWVASRSQELLRRVESFKHYTTLCNSAPSEILSLIALRAREALLLRSREIIDGNRTLLDAFFARWRGTLEWVPPRGGTVAFPRWLGRRSIEEVAAELVEKEGVLVVPGEIFDWPGGYFRVGLGRRNLPRAVEKLEGYLRRGGATRG